MVKILWQSFFLAVYCIFIHDTILFSSFCCNLLFCHFTTNFSRLSFHHTIENTWVLLYWPCLWTHLLLILLDFFVLVYMTECFSIIIIIISSFSSCLGFFKSFRLSITILYYFLFYSMFLYQPLDRNMDWLYGDISPADTLRARWNIWWQGENSLCSRSKE